MDYRRIFGNNRLNNQRTNPPLPRPPNPPPSPPPAAAPPPPRSSGLTPSGINNNQMSPSSLIGLHTIIENLFDKVLSNQSSITLTYMEIATLHTLSRSEAEICATLRTTNTTHLKVIKSLEATITNLSHRPTTTSTVDQPPAKTWAKIAAKNQSLSGPPPAPPSNKVLNEFKLGRFVIRSAPNQTPFNGLSPIQIRDKANMILKDINIGSQNKPLTIRGAHRL